MQTFFVSCPMNFENELIKEFETFWFQMMDLDGLPTREVLPEFVVYPGGVEFKTELHLGLQINFFSQIALRVLWRLGHFEARYFDQFEKGLQQLALEKYLDPQKINIQIESSKSRLFHEGNLLEATVKVLGARRYLYDKTAEISLFIRVVKDHVILSLDTSGPHLHFRGYRQQQGEAPLRENLASLVLQLAQIPLQSDTVLFDPYCGSGTFFFEAQLKNFPHLNRHYAWFKFKNIPALFKSDTWKKNYRWINSTKKINFLGIEKNPETYRKALNNQKVFQELIGPIRIDLLNDNSETMDLNIFGNKAVTLMTNPPYGERSAAGDIPKALARWESLDNISKIVVLHPENWKFKFKRLKCVQSMPLTNQGLKTCVSIFA